MSLRFTASRDGKPRATVVVRERLDLSVFVEAVALATFLKPGAPERIRAMGAREFEYVAREYMRGAGYEPAYWPENEDDEFGAAREAALERATKLWPEAAA